MPQAGPPPIGAIRTRIADLSGAARQVECSIVKKTPPPPQKTAQGNSRKLHSCMNWLQQ